MTNTIWKSKQTAGNNALLKRAKKESNAPIFQKASQLVNEQGEAAAVEYLLSFIRPELRDARRADYNKLCYPAADLGNALKMVSS